MKLSDITDYGDTKRHGTCEQDRTCPVCGAKACVWCTKKDGITCDNHRIKEK